jgi:hypothetical protein
LVRKGENDNNESEESVIDKERWVANHSKHVLTEHEKSVLGKGLNFAITPSKLPVKDLIAATECASSLIHDPTKKASFRSDVVKAIKHAKPPKQNISKEEREALKNLSKNKEILILPADKGRTTVILDKEEYDDKLQTLLSDSDTYAPLKKDPTTKYKNKLLKLLRQWDEDRIISKDLYWRLYPRSDLVPRIYGLPKIHKNNRPLRPIVASIGSITYRVAKFCHKSCPP